MGFGLNFFEYQFWLPMKGELMVSADDDPARELIAAAGQRLIDLDPLLADQPLPAGCGAVFAATDGTGRLTGLATCEHSADEPGSLNRTWGAARRFNLRPKVAGPDVARPLDQLMSQWQAHLAGVADIGEDDTSAVVTWPSRDVLGIRVLQRHGLAPLAVVAARTSRQVSLAGQHDGEVKVRRGGQADLGIATDFGVELVRYDAFFGEVVERPETRQGLRNSTEAILSGPDPWVWLAEVDGVPVGMLLAERPEDTAWLAAYTGVTPASYLQQGFVMPDRRAAGIGDLLVREYHAEIHAAGVPVTVLHYSQANPLSAPFWSQQGYRPLWTSWEARPARRLC